MTLNLTSTFSKLCRISVRHLAAPSVSTPFSCPSEIPTMGMDVKKTVEVPKIRRPLSPFAVFMQSQYGKLKSENPDSKATDLMKKASSLYAQLPLEEKEKLINAAKSDRHRYEADMKQLTQEQKMELQSQMEKKRQNKAVRERRRQWRATGRPVRPLNAPLLFMRERWIDRGNRKVTDFVRDLMVEWRNLPDERKQKFRDMESEAKLKFEEECAAWEAKLALEQKPIPGLAKKKSSQPKKLSKKKRATGAGKRKA